MRRRLAQNATVNGITRDYPILMAKDIWFASPSTNINSANASVSGDSSAEPRVCGRPPLTQCIRQGTVQTVPCRNSRLKQISYSRVFFARCSRRLREGCRHLEFFVVIPSLPGERARACFRRDGQTLPAVAGICSCLKRCHAERSRSVQSRRCRCSTSGIDQKGYAPPPR